MSETTQGTSVLSPPVVNRWWASLLMVGPLLAALLWLYWDTLLRLPEIWARDADYSHGYLVPVIALLFAARQWWRHGGPVRASVAAKDVQVGLSRIVIGAAVHGICLFSPDFLVFDVLSLLFAISGVFIVLGGRQQYRVFAFPIWFLIFMSPLPVVLYRWLALVLQQTSAMIAAGALDVLGVPAVRVGYSVHLPGHVMEVGAACSGLRGVLGILAMALAIGQFVDGSRLFRWSLVVVAIPVAVAANTVRVVLTGLIIYTVGPAWSQGWWHDFEGLLTSVLGVGLMLGATWFLSRGAYELRQRKQRASERADSLVPNRVGLSGHS